MKKRRGRHGEFTSSYLVIFLPMTILLIWAVMDVRTNRSGAWALLGVVAFMLACDIWFAGRVVVDAQGVRLYKLWTFIDLPWEEVRCVGSFTCRYARGGIPFILISPLEKPWEHAVSCFDVQTMRNYFRHGGARSLCLEYSKGMRKALDEYCPLPWTQLRCKRVGLMLNANALVGPDGDGEE